MVPFYKNGKSVPPHWIELGDVIYVFKRDSVKNLKKKSKKKKRPKRSHKSYGCNFDSIQNIIRSMSESENVIMNLGEVFSRLNVISRLL